MHKLNTIFKFMFLLFFVFGLSLVQAQESGKIQGKITDKNSGDPLPGANVFLEGTSLGAATSVDGEFTIRQIQPGNYSMIIRYVGYLEKKMPITVNAGSTMELNIELEYVAVESKVVTVTAQARGQQEAINQQLSSNTISNIVAADRIQEIPDANAAESVGRLPGISLSKKRW